ncbi:response regulator [Mucilaginibacter ginkgonis]|uniref:Response regulator transcription factor n=1 Tax=Mucilaginibacter ginkgonis TaxID=2682091 RepID=A0A6I4I5V6_9SPHI|nr:response regulator transcription factor [Mucilaginibacter ginkgonis]QQL50484.1 response regulator transcription factor [Mucilaginibacter ginkgonis]
MITVMIADGNEATVNAISGMLGYSREVEILGTANDGAKALDLISNGLTPDILLTDVHLAGMNGLALAKRLHQDFPFIKTMVFTQEEQEHYMADAFRSGVKSYISKNVSREELLFAIRQVHNGQNYICTRLASKLTELFLRGTPTDEANTSNMIDFSPRELEVLQLIADGATNNKIGEKLFISRRTVEGHRQAMINKTGVKNTPELIKYAMRYQLLRAMVSGN